MSSRIPLAFLLCIGIFATAPEATGETVTIASIANPYSQRAGHQYRHGVVPTLQAHTQSGKWLDNVPHLYSFDPLQTHDWQLHDRMLSYGGGVNDIGVTSGQPKVYLVVFGRQWGNEAGPPGNLTLTKDQLGEVPLLELFFSDLGKGNEGWSKVMTEYCDGSGVPMAATSCPTLSPHVQYPSGLVLAGVWYDNTVDAPVIASAHDLAVEALKGAAHFQNDTAESNRYAQYVILSPPGTHPDGFGTSDPNADFCAWHDFTSDKSLDGGPVQSGLGGVAFTNMPYVSDAGQQCGANWVNPGSNGAVDGVTLNEGHEYAETLTDQWPSGGWTNQSSVGGLQGEEDADECAWIKPGASGGAGNVTMGNDSFALQATWSNMANRCVLTQ